MELNEKNSIKYLTFESFKRFRQVRHAFSTRIGGVSDGVYSEMNLGYTSSDKKENISENFKIFSSAVGFNVENVVFSNQVHKTNMYHVKAKDKGKGLLRDSDIKEVDALLTNEKGVVLTTFYADCVPLFFFDAKTGSIALAHAGWRGTVMEIGRHTVNEMHNAYGCSLKDILVGIGPCIGKCCFETDEDVYMEFADKEYSASYITKCSNKYNIDLKGINRQILIDAGMSAENIEVTDLCTKCRSDLFYSHRLTGNPRGSMAAFIGLE